MAQLVGALLTGVTGDFSSKLGALQTAVTGDFSSRMDALRTSVTGDFSSRLDGLQTAVTGDFSNHMDALQTAVTGDFSSKIGALQTAVTGDFSSRMDALQTAVTGDFSSQLGAAKSETLERLDRLVEDQNTSLAMQKWALLQHAAEWQASKLERSLGATVDVDVDQNSDVRIETESGCQNFVRAFFEQNDYEAVVFVVIPFNQQTVRFLAGEFVGMSTVAEWEVPGALTGEVLGAIGIDQDGAKVRFLVAEWRARPSCEP